MHKCIPRESLTKTFLDAIEITRAVGMKYLWIDSWCIVQDDHNDWETEAAKMSSVYSGSSLNIAASSAKDGTQGCFPRPGDHSDGFEAEVCVNGRKGVHQFVPPGLYDQFVRKPPLASRAWVVQEKVLAPRTLHCGDRGMFWECRTTMASEDFPDGFNGSGARSYLSKESLLLRPDRLHSASWTWLVTWFSSCDLTYPGDKLVALAGVARLLKDKTQDQYLAGLWRKDLEINLRWKAWEQRPRPPYRAPAWSWAAVDGRIVFDSHQDFHGEGELYFRIHGVSVTNTGTDVCGAVSHGILTLDCRAIKKGTICWRLPQPSSAEGQVVALYADLGHEKVLFSFRLDSSEHEDHRVGQVIYFVLLHVGNNPHSHVGQDDFSEDTRVLFGLVLEEVDGSKQEYKRIGYFEYESCERCDRRQNEYPVSFFSGFFETVTINDTGVKRISLV